MKFLNFLVVLIACLFPCKSFSQKNILQFDHLGTVDGLSQSNVLCILQDSRGLMWFGTADGLNKYDGYKFTVYKHYPGNAQTIAGNHITDIEEDSNGDLWIATLGGGISRYDRKKERFTNYRFHYDSLSGIMSDFVTSIQQDSKGKLWIGTEEGLDMFDPVTNKFKHYIQPHDKTSPNDSFVKYVFEDSDKNLWVCTLNKGLNLFNRASNSFTSFKHDAKDTRSISSNNINTIFEDSRRRLWIGTGDGGMDLFNKKTGTFSHWTSEENNANSLSGDAVYAINEDVENNLWIGTENGGLSVYNTVSNTFENFKNDAINRESISNNSIYSIYKDSKNNMWLGNFADGIDLANRDKINFRHYNQELQYNSISNKHVLSIYEDKKKQIWIGTDGGGLDLFDPQNGSFKNFKHDKNNAQSICGNNVLTTCEDSKGNIWIGTWASGVTVFNPAKNSYKHFKNEPGNPLSLSSNNVWNIYEDKEKNVWLATLGGGLELLNPDGNSFTHFKVDPNNSKSISNNDVVSIFEDSDGQMWVCTDGGGLNLFDKRKKTFTRFIHDDAKNSISNDNVISIFEDSDKNLWISTRKGLNKFNKQTGRFTVFTTADGLPDNVIYGILEDEQKNLWISTNNGISRFNLITKTFKNFSIADGLQSNEFKEKAFCKSSSGLMYFGGNNGFNQFLPSGIQPINFEPSLVITGFHIFNEAVPITSKKISSPLQASITETKSITLPYSSSMFSLEFASLNYTTEEKKRYAYMLEGFDKTWNESGTARIATYTNLDPGKYIFKVKGLNNAGNWSSRMIVLEIIIKPPFWLTWWFRILVLVAFAGSIVAFYKYRVHTIKAQKKMLEKKVQEQTQLLLISAKDAQRARKAAEKAMDETKLLNKELKIKNKELEQFAYVASHDLQEPLRTTSSFVALLQKQYLGKMDDRADKYLNYISDASDRMKVLIKDLLDYSRIGTKGEPEKIDSNKILSNVLHDLTVATEEAKAEIRYQRLPEINGYPTEIKLLFQNLVINAIKFRKKDVAPQITINAIQVDGDWQFAFRDNGIGIARENNEKIFHIFQRLHTRTEYEGSGIGLSHCKKIVELHHGKIWVESAPGEGSAFYFTIPENHSPNN